MGFISTGDTTILNAYYTQKGRNLLLNGTEQDYNISYFALGDSDANYKINIPLGEGFVPDLTGDNQDCVVSLAQNINIKYPVQYKNDPPAPQYQVSFQRPDNGYYYNVLNCQINLDSITRYQLYNSSSNLFNPNRLKVNNNLFSPFVDLFSRIAILTGNTLIPTINDFFSDDNMVLEMLFDVNIFKNFNNTYLDTNNTNVINQTGDIKSPIELTFSSLNISGNTFYGEGKSSVSLFGREIGYVYQPYNTTDNSWSFYSAKQFEGIINYEFTTDNNNQITTNFSDFTLAARIYSRDVNTGLVNTFIYRGDTNLTNLSKNNLNNFNNDLKFANQYTKLFADDFPVINTLKTTIVTEGLLQKEVSNLDYFIKSSNIFSKLIGTNEYRSSKLTFSVYPKILTGIIPATLNIIFRYNTDILMNGDLDTSHISDSGDTIFINYDFTSTTGIFKNNIKTGTFTKNNCGTGFNGSNYTYIVPAGTYTGITQTIADTLATNDVNSNGQNSANTNGTCTPSVLFLSQLFSQNISKNDCPINNVGSLVAVNFPQGQFTSYVSQADADNKAIFAAQQYANTNGTCTSTPPFCLLGGQKIYTSNGLKNIEDINLNDIIITIHEKTFELGSYKVEKTFKGKVDAWYDIETVSGKITKCSPSHLFMVNTESKKAYELSINDNLMVKDNFSDDVLILDKIKSIKINNETVNIYNIEVEDAHTYFTENGIWHHNKVLTPQLQQI